MIATTNMLLGPYHRDILAQSDVLGRVMVAGHESTVSCKTYVATLAVLRWFASQLLETDSTVAIDQLSVVRDEVRRYLANWEAHVAELLPLLTGVESIFITGRGDSLASAGTGGLVLKESTRLHAEGMSAPAFIQPAM